MAKVNINNTERRIEAIYQVSGGITSPAILLAPPGFSKKVKTESGEHIAKGDMNSPLMKAMAKCFQHLGFSVLRFDYSEPERELEDSSLALGWLRRRHPEATSLWVGGVSQGAWTSLQLLMRRPDISCFVVASLPVHFQDFAFLAPCPSSGLIIEGTKDPHKSEFSYPEFIKRIRTPRGVAVRHEMVEGANHLFDTQEEEFVQIVSDYIKTKHKRR